MKTQKYNWILYFISATILMTIAVQFYWNYKNYQQNKQRVINEIQTSLDNALEQYFVNLSKETYFTIVDKGGLINKEKIDNAKENIFHSIDTSKNSISSIEIFTSSNKKEEDCFLHNSTNNHSCNNSYKHKGSVITTRVNKDRTIDTLIQQDKIQDFQLAKNRNISVFKGKKASDSLKLINSIKTVFISIQNDTIDHQKIDSILQKDLINKNIAVEYAFDYYKGDSIYTSHNSTAFKEFKNIESKSTFLGKDKRFKMKYTNPNTEALKRSSTGILLSLFLSLAVISSLFYLLKIINNQKQLAEIKNDLISNITHEFKTPITTVSTALEAINNFNVLEDTEKTKKYINISENQIKKLHLMVEKLLETATLDSEKLLLKKEEVEVTHLLEKLVRKHQLLTNNKLITFTSSTKEIILKIDVFHIENAVSNLIDNAIKYGGDTIEVNLNILLNNIEISVADNGAGIDKNQQEKIFDKFYRVPKGNTHDVKGFGIGLYYTKKIIEKHLGTISLTSNSKQTVFKIILPNEF